jgi:TonB family protein
MSCAPRFVAALLAVILASQLAATEKPPEQSPRQILESVAQRMMSSDPAGSFSLVYGLRFPNGKVGTFRWRQLDENNWRQDLSLGSLALAEGVFAGKGWQTNGVDRFDVWWLLSTLLEVRKMLNPKPEGAVELRSERVRGGRLTAIWVPGKSKRPYWSVTLTSPDLNLAEASEGFVRCVFDRWTPLGEAGAIPSAASIWIQDQQVFELRLESAVLGPPVASDLVPIEGAVSFVHCTGRTEPSALVKVQPVYPDEARGDRAQGPVVVTATIEADGSVTNTRPVWFPGSQKGSGVLLAQSAVKAVSQWRYEPARCKGEAFAVHLNVIVNFTLK